MNAERRGMTLIEVVVALFVMVVILAGVISSVVHAAALTRDSQIVYRETAIANDLVERMRSMTFAELKAELQAGNAALGIAVIGTNPATTQGNVPPTTPSGAGTGPVLAGEYSYKWTRSCRDLSADPLRITVRVWPDGVPNKTISVVTYISASGLINRPQ